MESVTIRREEEKEKKENGVKRFFKAVFVHNFWGKISALLISAVLWALAVGLNTKLDNKPAPPADATAVVETVIEK